jgi:hypothetical protein
LENCGSSAFIPQARSKQREPALGSGKNLFVDWKTMKYMADFAKETAKLKKKIYGDNASHELNDDNAAIACTVRSLTRVLDVPIHRLRVCDLVQWFRDEEMLLNVEVHTGLLPRCDTDDLKENMHHLGARREIDADRTHPCPHASFTLVLDGPFLGVYGTIANTSFTTNQWLTPMFPINAFPHAHCSSSLGLDQRVIQVLIALRYGIMELRQVLRKLPVIPNYPLLNELMGLESVTLSRPLDTRQLVYRGTFNTRDAVIKFCRSYCLDAHKCLANMGMAPNIFWSGARAGWEIIVMEYVEGNVVSSLNDSQRQACTRILQNLHDQGYVHGDVQAQNFIWQSGNSNLPLLVDFENSGRVGETFYRHYGSVNSLPYSAGRLVEPQHELQILL